jgi:hypothetical protein
MRRRILLEGETSSTGSLDLADAALGAALAGVAAEDGGAWVGVGVGVAGSLTFAITETSLAGFFYYVSKNSCMPRKQNYIEGR